MGEAGGCNGGEGGKLSRNPDGVIPYGVYGVLGHSAGVKARESSSAQEPPSVLAEKVHAQGLRP